MTDPVETVAESEFVLRLDLGNVPSRGQQEAIIDALRRVADTLEDYPMTETGQQCVGRRSFNALGVSARWTWQV